MVMPTVQTDTPQSASAAQVLQLLLNQGKIRPLDLAFGEFIASQETHNACNIGVLGAYLSLRLGEQHSCLPIAQLGQPFLPHFRFPAVSELRQQLSQARCVAVINGDDGLDDVASARPLVVDNNQLYLQRYWQYEVQLAAKINQLTAQHHELDRVAGRQLLGQLFVDHVENDVAGQGADWQKMAVCLAASQKVSMITGGPGTGKTTTVIRLMALLQGLARASNKRISIKLAAPTGKAAARLSQSIASAKSDLPIELQVDLPSQCSTIHRLLGSVPNSPFFKFNQQQPLHLDVLIVDEASMVDLPLMAKLFAALPPRAKIVLLGDKDQLASVEAGSVLSDMCAAAMQGKVTVNNQPPCYSDTLLNTLSELCQETLLAPDNQLRISDSLALLHKSYRFSENSGIGRLARAINARQLDQVQALYADKQVADVLWYKTADPKLLVGKLLAGYQDYFSALTQAKTESQRLAVYAKLQRQQVLCAQKSAPWGVHHINALVEAELQKQGLIDTTRDFYPGRPVMLNQNDHSLGLYNGDIGIVLQDPDQSLLYKVWFVTAQGTLRGVLPSRLPPHETVYAMTIHKSQGSEFDHVYLCLPRVETRSQGRLLSRELLYTGLTRSKKTFSLFSDEQALAICLQRQCKRGSGLSDRLL
jgi:exodeoxyribonuclease V alpha subunit